MSDTNQTPAKPGEVASFDITLKILRTIPSDAPSAGYGAPVPEPTSRWDTFTLTMRSGDRVLDALHKVKWEHDGSLTFRRSCAHGVCGSDAMRINGRNRLACKTLLKDLNLAKPITIEPIKGLPVLKDLVVNMEPFFDAYREVQPFLIAHGVEPTAERLQSVRERSRFDDTTKCILCACCTTSCPVFWNDGQYFGPAAIVNAHRWIFDSRDDGASDRMEILNDREGVWRCRTTFNCTDACPRGIQVTKAISQVKRAILIRTH
ncbi:MAG: succinate dehydrogenase iron-sulfur subunit [Micrococcales bacterium]|nr:succinate dehydrogenase iron-sulfur subunit [Micrococcales bacterium]